MRERSEPLLSPVHSEALIQHSEEYSMTLQTWALYNVALRTTFSLSPPTFCPALVVMLQMCLVQVSLLTTGTARMSCSSFSGSLMSPKIRLTLLDSSYLRLSGICTWLTSTNPLTYAYLHLLQRSSSRVTQISMEHYSIQRLNGRISILYKCCVQR